MSGFYRVFFYRVFVCGRRWILWVPTRSASSWRWRRRRRNAPTTATRFRASAKVSRRVVLIRFRVFFLFFYRVFFFRGGFFRVGCRQASGATTRPRAASWWSDCWPPKSSATPPSTTSAGASSASSPGAAVNAPRFHLETGSIFFFAGWGSLSGGAWPPRWGHDPERAGNSLAADDGGFPNRGVVTPGRWGSWPQSPEPLGMTPGKVGGGLWNEGLPELGVVTPTRLGSWFPNRWFATPGGWGSRPQRREPLGVPSHWWLARFPTFGGRDPHPPWVVTPDGQRPSDRRNEGFPNWEVATPVWGHDPPARETRRTLFGLFVSPVSVSLWGRDPKMEEAVGASKRRVP